MKVEKVLVADDSKVVVFKLKRMLEARGMVVDSVTSGREALDYLKSQKPDAIFMDFMMADMDGYEATGMIASNPETSAIPVVMCTGHDSPQDRQRARENGAVGFVTKPVDDATLDAVLAELRQRVAGPAPIVVPATVAVPMPDVATIPVVAPISVAVPTPVAAHAPIAATELPASAAAESPSRVAERIAREVAERLVREATAALSAASEQAARRVAQSIATDTTHDALASWRKEVATTNEHAEIVAVAAATRVAREIAQQVHDEAEETRRSTEKTDDHRLQDALAAVEPIAERVALQTLESTKAAMEDASRQVLETARADLHESVRIAAEAAAKPAAETAARAVAEQLMRVSLAAARDDEGAMRSEVEQAAVGVAERVARELVEAASNEAEAARNLAVTAAEEKLQEAMATVQPIAERAALQTLESAKVAMDEASRQVLESARVELQESVRIAAEAAAKPVAEAAARAAAERIAVDLLAAAHDDEVASRLRVEQRTIAVAERVGRELVKLAFEAATSGRQTPVGEVGEAMHAAEGGEYDPSSAAARADVKDSTPAAAGGIVAGPPATTGTMARPPISAPLPPPPWGIRAGLLTWLGALTLTVLYLLARSFS